MQLDASPGWRPDFGSLRHVFDFDPLNHAAKRALKDDFQARLRTETSQYGFYFAGEVRIEWELFVDEQARWESDSGADVDNIATLLNDSICGPGGQLFDDVQVQRLEIAWLPNIGESSFELTVRCSPMDVVTRPASFYQMSDSLWYPINDGLASARALHHLNDMTMHVEAVRQFMVEAGATRRQAFEGARLLAPIAQGFHTTRAKASGFQVHALAEWTTSVARPPDLPAPDEREYPELARALLGRLEH